MKKRGGQQKSLQEIAEDSGEETKTGKIELNKKDILESKVEVYKQLKNPQARELFAFIESIL